MEELIDFLLFGFLVVTAFGIIRIRDLFAAVMLMSLFSLVSACLLMSMDAVDVAFTEAAVGAGISTVLMLATLAITRRREKRRHNQAVKPVPLAMALLTGGALIYGTFDMPRYGDPAAPIHLHMAPRFIEQSPIEVGPPNIVTSVLASYRGYDTFGETTVVFTAAIGVLLLLGGRGGELLKRVKATAKQKLEEGQQKPEKKKIGRIRDNLIVTVTSKPLIPFIMLFGLYVQFHGDYGPGGGFQAGVIFAASIVLYTLVFGLRRARKAFPPRILELLIAAGVLLYASVGLVAMARGGQFLDYNVLAHDPVHGQHLGILLIELGIGLTVTTVMVTLFFLFAGRRFRGPSRKA